MHVDHRLLHPAAQEMSIVTSCRLIGADVFIPPFNKWNEYTEEICADRQITLVKFEDGWRGCEHEVWDVRYKLWFLQSR